MTRDTGKKRAATAAADSDVLQSMVSNYTHTHIHTITHIHEASESESERLNKNMQM